MLGALVFRGSSSETGAALLDPSSWTIYVLKLGLAAVLVFVGAKMLVSNVYHLPLRASLLFIACVLVTSVVASLRATRAPEEEPLDAMSR